MAVTEKEYEVKGKSFYLHLPEETLKMLVKNNRIRVQYDDKNKFVKVLPPKGGV